MQQHYTCRRCGSRRIMDMLLTEHLPDITSRWEIALWGCMDCGADGPREGEAGSPEYAEQHPDAPLLQWADRGRMDKSIVTAAILQR